MNFSFDSSTCFFEVETVKRNFAKDVNAYLTKRGITYKELAKILGKSERWLSYRLQCYWMLTLKSMVNIITALDMKIEINLKKRRKNDS